MCVFVWHPSPPSIERKNRVRWKLSTPEVVPIISSSNSNGSMKANEQHNYQCIRLDGSQFLIFSCDIRRRKKLFLWLLVLSQETNNKIHSILNKFPLCDVCMWVFCIVIIWHAYCLLQKMQCQCVNVYYCCSTSLTMAFPYHWHTQLHTHTRAERARVSHIWI